MTCVDCGTEISAKATRCGSCAATERWRHDPHRVSQKYCLDCGAPIGCRATRCKTCSALARWADEDFYSTQVQALRERWQDDAFRAMMLEMFAKREPQKHTEEVKQKLSQGMKERWAQGYYSSPETAQKRRDALRRRQENGDLATEEAATKRSNLMRQRWKRGDFDHIHDGGYSDERRRKMSVGMKAARARGCWSSEEQSAQRSLVMKQRWERGDFIGVFNTPSDLEVQFADALAEQALEYESQYKLNGAGFLFDFFIVGTNLLIEVDGDFWHYSEWALQHGRDTQDRRKDEFAQGQGYKVLRIRGSEIEAMGARSIIQDRIVPLMQSLEKGREQI